MGVDSFLKVIPGYKTLQGYYKKFLPASFYITNAVVVYLFWYLINSAFAYLGLAFQIKGFGREMPCVGACGGTGFEFGRSFYFV